MWNSRRTLYVVVSLSGLMASIAAAKDPPRVAEPASVASEPGESERPQNLIKTAEGQLKEMKAASARIRELLGSAREERDVIKVLCLSDKLDQAEVAFETATERLASLRVAVAQADRVAMHHESTIIGVLRTRAIALASEATQCVGEEMGFIGENDLEVTIDPGMPPDDVNPFNPGMPPEDAGLFPREDVLLMPPPLTSPTT